MVMPDMAELGMITSGLTASGVAFLGRIALVKLVPHLRPSLACCAAICCNILVHTNTFNCFHANFVPKFT